MKLKTKTQGGGTQMEKVYFKTIRKKKNRTNV